ncbi:MAG: ribosome-associated heat shock protein Hsp15 [Paraglaciecola sp.]|jgi:ribosome-associated heat shock protein Hsp15
MHKSYKKSHMDAQLPVRLDKWLWAARLFKTRAIARDAVQTGKVQYNGQRSKPGKIVELAANIKIPYGYDVQELVVLELSEQRRGAPIAQLMYLETEASVQQRERNAQARKLSAFHSPSPDHRPDKKQRRQIIQLKHQ